MPPRFPARFTPVTFNQAFTKVIDLQRDQIDPNLVANGPEQSIHLIARYDPRFRIATALGEIEIPEIEFVGDVTLIERFAPIELAAEYRDEEGARKISQVVRFAAMEHQGLLSSVEFHRMPEEGRTVIALRVDKKVRSNDS